LIPFAFKNKYVYNQWFVFYTCTYQVHIKCGVGEILWNVLVDPHMAMAK